MCTASAIPPTWCPSFICGQIERQIGAHHQNDQDHFLTLLSDLVIYNMSEQA